jgi:hypothetical protein
MEREVVEEITEAAFKLVQDIVERHEIRSLDDFTCPRVRELASKFIDAGWVLFNGESQGCVNSSITSGSSRNGAGTV